jgi:hypothetical protein
MFADDVLIVPRQHGGHGGVAPAAAPTASFPGLDMIVNFLGGEEKIMNMVSSVQAAIMPKMMPLMKSMGPLAVKFLQTQQAASIEEIPPILRKDAKRVRITYGPYKLKGAAVSPRD